MSAWSKRGLQAAAFTSGMLALGSGSSDEGAALGFDDDAFGGKVLAGGLALPVLASVSTGTSSSGATSTRGDVHHGVDAAGADGVGAGNAARVPLEVHRNAAGPDGVTAAASAVDSSARSEIPVRLPLQAAGNRSRPTEAPVAGPTEAPVAGLTEPEAVTGAPGPAAGGVVTEIVDLDGQLLAVAEAMPTAGRPATDPGAERAGLVPSGPDLPRFGPTGIPTLQRLKGLLVPCSSNAMPMPKPQPDSALPDDVTSGSALSVLDAAQLFG